MYYILNTIILKFNMFYITYFISNFGKYNRFWKNNITRTFKVKVSISAVNRCYVLCTKSMNTQSL